MDFLNVIDTRKTIRKYENFDPPIEDIKRIIESARLAPSATNTQNWKFIAIRDDVVKQKMLTVLENKFDEISSWKESENLKSKILFYKNYSTFFAKAPVVIVAVLFPKESYISNIYRAHGVSEEEFQESRPDSSLLSIGGAIENMSLTAHYLGYGTCWMCAPMVAAKEFKEILNLEDEAKIVSLLTLGKPLEPSPSQPNKKMLDEIMQII